MVKSVTFSPDGKTVASGSDDKTVCLFNAETGELLQSLKGHRYSRSLMGTYVTETPAGGGFTSAVY